MSGAGKTYWSKQLEKKGFIRYSCDDLLETKLSQLPNDGKLVGIRKVAKWMGQPYEKQYPHTSNLYLQAESESLNEIINKSNIRKRNVVIDTTGSVIYVGLHILKQLAKMSKIVWLETPASILQKMLKLYLDDPKPVIWKGIFQKKNRETNREALARCYPLLLKSRIKKYKKLADGSLNYHMLRLPSFNADKLLQEIHNIKNS